MAIYLFDSQYYNKGYKVICGIDEAGRGPLAGPVFAAAVILDLNKEIEGLNDSKKLTEQKRERLFGLITENSLAYSIAHATVEEIEEYNILQATMLAMRRAVEQLPIKPDIILVDGNRVPSSLPVPAYSVVKGDSLSASIAAASILAKVSRDRYMREMDLKYPCYQFSKHKGYGTALHIQLIRQYGCSSIHRRSFLTKIIE
ncbi:MAG TPA: ribonuclease HII [Candidatus Avimonas sp.]|jgi:ribonuclease HII|nr:ribonuclease HII [Clostridiales bacterium]HOB35959.1 ribonuclease HII [Candidatus Avimonas sp.]HQA15870.1 ribonuclease HII [Candidatus Avimonas sp.]HQD37395.1 ribonuclease HII [Candidatus Avimonas sp.]